MRRPGSEMWLLAGALLAATTLVAACSRTSPGASQAPLRVTVTTPANAEDRRRIKSFADTSAVPGFVPTVLAEGAAARRLFRGAVFPRQTFGRRLVGIIYRRATEPNMDPREALILVYEGGLVVSEAHYAVPPFGEPFYRGADTTRAGSTTISIKSYDSMSETSTVTAARWRADGVNFSITGPGMTKGQVVAIAASLAR